MGIIKLSLLILLCLVPRTQHKNQLHPTHHSINEYGVFIASFKKQLTIWIVKLSLWCKNINPNSYMPIEHIFIKLRDSLKISRENLKNRKDYFHPMIGLGIWRNKLLFLGRRRLSCMRLLRRNHWRFRIIRRGLFRLNSYPRKWRLRIKSFHFR